MRVFASRTVEFRVVQVAIAGAIAALVVVLAFVLGLKIGTGPENTGLGAVAPADVWVLRLMAVSDNENGRTKAESVRKQLERLQGEEVTIHPLPSGDELMIAVGAWLSNPGEDPGRYANAHALKREIRALESRDGAKLFKDAEFERLDLGRQDLERQTR